MKKLISTHNFILGLIILVILGGFFRFYNLSNSPYWMDEGYTINAVLSIQEKGASILDSGNYYNCPTYCYPTSIITNYLGNNSFSYRLLAVIAGIIFVIAIFFITKKLFGKIIGLLISLAVTFSYWQIAWSRQARWYTLFILFFWLAIFFFYQFINDQNKKYKIWQLFSIIIFTILACLTHGLGYLLPLIFIIWYLFDQIFIKKELKIKKTIIYIIVISTIVFIFYLISNINLFAQLYNKINFNYTLPYYISFLIRNYWLFIVFSLYALFTPKKEEQNIRYFLIFVFLMYLIPLSFLTNLVHYRYLFHVTPVLLILGILGMSDIYSLIQKKWQRIIYIGIITILFFTIGGGILIPRDTYILESDNPETLGNRPHYAYTPQPDWNEAYDFIKNNKTEKDIAISSMPQFNKIFLGIPGYWIKYNYLGFTDRESKITNNKEYYVGAEVINNLEELKSITLDNHGYITIDYMAMDGKIEQSIIDYINTTFPIVFYKKTNSYSQVWVYKF